jgi:branched-subunit amino acid transport protein
MNCEKILHVFLIVWVLYYIVRELILITKAHIKFRQWVKDYRAKKKADNNDDEQLTA